MTRINPTDHVLLLLQERLDRAIKREKQPATEKKSSRQRIAALAAIKDLDERSFRKALVRGLLSQKLGERLTGDPAFDRIVSKVAATIEDSDEGRELMSKAAESLRR